MINPLIKSIVLSFAFLPSTGYCALIMHPTASAVELVSPDNTSKDKLSVIAETRIDRQVRVRKKLSLSHRIALKILEKKANKATSKFKSSSDSDTDQRRPLSTLSLIFGSVGLGIVLIPYVGALAIPCAIAGIVLGIIGIKKEGSNTLNILGIVFGGALLLLIAIAILVLLAIYLA